MTPETILLKLRDLINNIPDLAREPPTPKVQFWLGEASGFIKESGELGEFNKLMLEIGKLEIFTDRELFIKERMNATFNIRAVLFRVQTIMQIKAIEAKDAEVKAAKVQTPDVSQEFFIGVGKSFDFFKAISNIFGQATKEILIVDPYLDNKILTKFAEIVEEKITIKLLTNTKSHNRGTIQPAFEEWVTQYGSIRPIELRIAPNNSLHDRLVIVDKIGVWMLSQSFKDFAIRADGNIMPLQQPDLKLEACNAIWDDAKPI